MPHVHIQRSVSFIPFVHIQTTASLGCFISATCTYTHNCFIHTICAYTDSCVINSKRTCFYTQLFHYFHMKMQCAISSCAFRSLNVPLHTHLITTQIQMFQHIHTYCAVYIYMFLYIYICLHMCVYICVCVCAFTSMITFPYMHVTVHQKCLRTCTYICLHQHTRCNKLERPHCTYPHKIKKRRTGSYRVPWVPGGRHHQPRRVHLSSYTHMSA
jgi:hypothetical protein